MRPADGGAETADRDSLEVGKRKAVKKIKG